jgi:hypothetical protein
MLIALGSQIVDGRTARARGSAGGMTKEMPVFSLFALRSWLSTYLSGGE